MNDFGDPSGENSRERSRRKLHRRHRLWTITLLAVGVLLSATTVRTDIAAPGPLIGTIQLVLSHGDAGADVVGQSMESDEQAVGGEEGEAADGAADGASAGPVYVDESADESAEESRSEANASGDAASNDRSSSDGGSAAAASSDEESEAAAHTPEEEEQTLTVLLMGLDGEEATGGEPARTDTLMLARIDPETGKTTLISIPRDLYVEDVAPGGGADRINSAYAYGGAQKTVEAVEGLTDADVDHHVVADFQGFEEVVDSLGGVEVDVEGDYLDHQDIPVGEQTLDGEEALLYARYRKTPAGDLGRIERQQELLASLREQALSWDSIASIPGIIRSLDENVETDMGAAEMVSLGHTLARNGQDGGFDSAQLAGEPLTLTDGREVLVPVEETNEQILRESLD